MNKKIISKIVNITLVFLMVGAMFASLPNVINAETTFYILDDYSTIQVTDRDSGNYSPLEIFENYGELPELIAFDFTPKVADTTHGGCEVEVTIGVSGNLSSIELVMVTFNAPHGIRGLSPGFGFPNLSVPPDGVIIDSLTLPQYAERGEWIVGNVHLLLNSGGSINWNTVELQALGFPTILTVTNSSSDNKPPTLSHFDFVPKVLTLSPTGTSALQVTIGAEDPSGVKLGGMDFTQPNVASVGWSFEDGDTPTDGVFEHTFNWSLAIGPEGIYIADRLLLVDGVGNYKVWSTNDLSSLGYPTQLEVRLEGGLPGDANGDGVVNSLDITKVERIIVGLDAETPGADANQDGVVNNLDITKVERIIVGLD